MIATIPKGRQQNNVTKIDHTKWLFGACPAGGCGG
jgi:hypothetical protein